MSRVTLVTRTIVVVLSLLVFAALAVEAHAQAVTAQTEIKAVTGRVEMLRQGQQWRAATVGSKLAEGDEIRAWSGASAELQLPDGTSLLLAENSRLTVTKVAIDPQTRSRMGVFHLSVGKVRAALAQSAIQLVQARQSNFVITTPGGVAAARGTIYIVSYDPATATTLVAVVRGTVLFIDCLTGNFVNIGLNNYVSQTGSQPITGVVPTSSLPTAVQDALTSASNPNTQNQRAITGSPPDVCADFAFVQSLLGRIVDQGPAPVVQTGTLTTGDTVGRDQAASTTGQGL